MAHFENITLEKGMYSVPGKSFTQVLEELEELEAAAKAAAARLLEEQEAEASRKAEEIIKKARQLAELEQQKEREALKEQFGQLVALAAAQVTGKMLTEEDQRRINREAIDSLDS